MTDLDLQVTDLARELLLTAMIISGPVLLVGLCVGLTVSLVQALTSVQEQTMSLVPKMFSVVVVALILLAPAIQLLRDYATSVFTRMVEFGLS